MDDHGHIIKINFGYQSKNKTRKRCSIGKICIEAVAKSTPFYNLSLQAENVYDEVEQIDSNTKTDFEKNFSILSEFIRGCK